MMTTTHNTPPRAFLLLGFSLTALLLATYTTARRRRRRRENNGGLASRTRRGETDEEEEEEDPRVSHYACRVGVIGGMGPASTALFAHDVVNQRIRLYRAMHRCEKMGVPWDGKGFTTKWSSEEIARVARQTSPGRHQLLDQDYIPITISMETTTPPRPLYILGQSPVDPAPHMARACRRLLRGGCTHLAMICNTAHHFWEEAERLVKKEYASSVDDDEESSPPAPVFLNMIALTLDYVVRVCRSSKSSITSNGGGSPPPPGRVIKVGLLATEATLKSKVYERVASSQGLGRALRFVSTLDVWPPERARASQDNIHAVIFGERGVKAGCYSRENFRALMLETLALLRFDPEIETVVLGCTEFPLVFPLAPEEHDDSRAFREAVEACFPPGDDRDTLLGTSRGHELFVDPGRVLADHVVKLTLLSRVR